MLRKVLPVLALAFCIGIHLCARGLTSIATAQQAGKPASSLVSVPVVVTDANGRYVSDLEQSDFEIVENGVKQRVSLFKPVTEPFSIVLLLDTSISTQAKLGDIRRAAQVFVDQLQKSDRIKVVTFDDQVHEMNEFSADRAVVKKVILNTQTGYSTKFYDGMNVALESLREIEGRKAIVVFSDGVDYRSDYASAESTLRSLEQDGVVVYPIRFSTRVAAEKQAREQAGQGSQLPTREVVKSTSGSKQPDPGEVPTSEPRKTGPLGLPSPEDIIRGRQDRRRDRLPPGDRPPAGEIGVDLPTGRTDPRVSSRGRERKEPTDDPIKVMLDRLYVTADTYLQTAAEKSGGQLLRADEITSLPAAFSQVAAELRSQYLLGFESPSNNLADYRLIKVTSSRPGVVVRARAGYRLGR